MLNKLRSKRGIVIGYLVLFPVALILVGEIGRQAGKMGAGGEWAVGSSSAKIERLVHGVKEHNL